MNDRGGYTVPTSRLYPYQWNWDSGFTALGIWHFNKWRAWLEIMALLDAQWQDGMVPHIVFRHNDPDYFPGPNVWSTETEPPTSGHSQPPVLGDNPIFNCTHYQNDGVTHNIGQHQSWEDIKFFIRCSVSPPFVTYDFSNTNVSDLQYKVYINEVLHKEWGLADVTIEGPYLLNNDSSRIGFTVETPFLLSGTQLNSGDEVSWDFLGSVTRSRMISSGLDGNQGSYTIPGGNSPAPTPTPGQPQPTPTPVPQPTPTPVPQPTPTPVPQPTPTPDSGGGGGGYTGGYWSGCYFNGIPMWGSVYVTPYQSFADVSVYVTGFSSFADLNVYVTEFASFATSCGQWHQTDFASFADFSVYFTSFQSFADFSIYYTDFASFAGR